MEILQLSFQPTSHLDIRLSALRCDLSQLLISFQTAHKIVSREIEGIMRSKYSIVTEKILNIPHKKMAFVLLCARSLPVAMCMCVHLHEHTHILKYKAA